MISTKYVIYPQVHKRLLMFPISALGIRDQAGSRSSLSRNIYLFLLINITVSKGLMQFQMFTLLKENCFRRFVFLKSFLPQKTSAGSRVRFISHL